MCESTEGINSWTHFLSRKNKSKSTAHLLGEVAVILMDNAGTILRFPIEARSEEDAQAAADKLTDVLGAVMSWLDEPEVQID